MIIRTEFISCLIAFVLAAHGVEPADKSPANNFLKLAEIDLASDTSIPAKKTSIDRIVTELQTAHPNLKIGIERLAHLNSAITAYTHAISAETEADAVRRVSYLIKEQTDYECRYEGRWMIIIPQIDKARFDQPTSLRMCITPAAKGVPVKNLFHMVKGAQPKEPVAIFLNRSFTKIASGSLINSEDRTVPCFQFLCDVADQLSERGWQMYNPSHMNDESNQKDMRPIKLGLANVRFHTPHTPGQIRVSRENGR